MSDNFQNIGGGDGGMTRGNGGPTRGGYWRRHRKNGSNNQTMEGNSNPGDPAQLLVAPMDQSQSEPNPAPKKKKKNRRAKRKSKRFNSQALNSESVEQSFEDSSYLDDSQSSRNTLPNTSINTSSTSAVPPHFDVDDIENRFNNRFKRPAAGIYGPPALNETKSNEIHHNSSKNENQLSQENEKNQESLRKSSPKEEEDRKVLLERKVPENDKNKMSNGQGGGPSQMSQSPRIPIQNRLPNASRPKQQSSIIPNQFNLSNREGYRNRKGWPRKPQDHRNQQNPFGNQSSWNGDSFNGNRRDEGPSGSYRGSRSPQQRRDSLNSYQNNQNSNNYGRNNWPQNPNQREQGPSNRSQSPFYDQRRRYSSERDTWNQGPSNNNYRCQSPRFQDSTRRRSPSWSQSPDRQGPPSRSPSPRRDQRRNGSPESFRRRSPEYRSPPRNYQNDYFRRRSPEDDWRDSDRSQSPRYNSRRNESQETDSRRGSLKNRRRNQGGFITDSREDRLDPIWSMPQQRSSYRSQSPGQGSSRRRSPAPSSSSRYQSPPRYNQNRNDFIRRRSPENGNYGQRPPSPRGIDRSVSPGRRRQRPVSRSSESRRGGSNGPQRSQGYDSRSTSSRYSEARNQSPNRRRFGSPRNSYRSPSPPHSVNYNPPQRMDISNNGRKGSQSARGPIDRPHLFDDQQRRHSAPINQRVDQGASRNSNEKGSQRDESETRYEYRGPVVKMPDTDDEYYDEETKIDHKELFNDAFREQWKAEQQENERLSRFDDYRNWRELRNAAPGLIRRMAYPRVNMPTYIPNMAPEEPGSSHDWMYNIGQPMIDEPSPPPNRSTSACSHTRFTRKIVRPDHVTRKLQNPCIFCYGTHRADQCPEIPEASNRRKFIIEANRCLRCFKRHRNEKCDQKEGFECKYCNDDPNLDFHHSALCEECNTEFE